MWRGEQKEWHINKKELWVGTVLAEREGVEKLGLGGEVEVVVRQPGGASICKEGGREGRGVGEDGGGDLGWVLEVGGKAGWGGVCAFGEDGGGQGVKGSGQGCMEDKGVGEKVGKGGGGRVQHGNVACERFCSRWGCKGSEGVNGLVREWGERNWVVPPLSLLRVAVGRWWGEGSIVCW